MLEQVRLMHDYHQWATARIQEALAALPEGDFTKEIANGTLRAVTDHIIDADYAWWQQLTSGRWPDGDLERPAGIPEYIEHCKRVESDIAVFVDALDDECAVQYLTYSISDKEYSTRIDMALLHVFNHAAYHRGQFALRLRALGHTPPRTDLTVMLRER